MSRRTDKNVGVIGLGIIGSRVAESLRRRGFHVFVWNRTPRPFPNFVGSRAEVAEICDFLQIFVSDDDALLESIEAMKRSLQAHHIVMAHSTVAPHTTRAAAEIVQRRGAQFLDAPFTGSKIAAGKGELVYYVGGEEAAIQRARPVLQGSSKEIIEIGEIGQATTVKVATNMITANAVQATAEALALVHSAGISVEKFAAAMAGNASQSPTLAMKLPKMMEADFETHFSVKHMLKDVQIATRLGHSAGLRFGSTEAVRDSLRTQAEEGRGDADFSAILRSFFPDRAPLDRAEQREMPEEQPDLGLSEAPAEPPPRAEEKSADGAGDREGEKTVAAPDENVTKPFTDDVQSVTSGPEVIAAAELPKDDLVAEEELAPSAQPTSIEAVSVAAEAAPHSNGQPQVRRGLFSRMFGKVDAD